MVAKVLFGRIVRLFLLYFIFGMFLCSCADLTVKNVHYEQFTGPNLAMKAKVKNKGSKQASASITSLSIRYNLTDPYIEKARIATPALDAGQEIEQYLWFFPSSELAKPGNCLYTNVCADAEGIVSELSEQNNCETISFMNRRYCRACDLCCSQTLPASFDWRNQGGDNWITTVKDQAQCGSCWAFAAVAVVEAMHNAQGPAVEISNLDLSEQNLVSCGGAGDCEGGFVTSALQYVMSNKIVGESAFPYQSQNCVNGDGDCFPVCSCSGNECARPCNCTFGSYHSRWKISGWHHVPVSSSTDPVSEIKRALLCRGPLAVCGTWSIDIQGNASGHCVLLVGWDNNAVPSFIQSLFGWSSGAWFFKNSWGTGWGGSGYGLVPFSGHTFSNIVNRAYYVENVNP